MSPPDETLRPSCIHCGHTISAGQYLCYSCVAFARADPPPVAPGGKLHVALLELAAAHSACSDLRYVDGTRRDTAFFEHMAFVLERRTRAILRVLLEAGITR